MSTSLMNCAHVSCVCSNCSNCFYCWLGTGILHVCIDYYKHSARSSKSSTRIVRHQNHQQHVPNQPIAAINTINITASTIRNRIGKNSAQHFMVDSMDGESVTVVAIILCCECMTHVICISYEWWILIWHIHLKKEAEKNRTDTFRWCAHKKLLMTQWKWWVLTSSLSQEHVASLIFINKSRHGSSHGWTCDRNGVDKQMNTPRRLAAATTTKRLRRNKNKTLCSNIFLNVTDFWWHIIFEVPWYDNSTRTHSLNRSLACSDTHTLHGWPIA